MHTINFPKFKETLKQAVGAHYFGLAQMLGKDFCNGYSLYTSDDVPNIGPVANRTSAVKTKPGDELHIYYRYSADEWSEWDDRGLFDEVNTQTREYATLSDYLENVAPKILHLCADVLAELKESGLFRTASPDLFLLVWVSDSESPIIWESAARLNSRAQYEEFIREFKPPR